MSKQNSTRIFVNGSNINQDFINKCVKAFWEDKKEKKIYSGFSIKKD